MELALSERLSIYNVKLRLGQKMTKKITVDIRAISVVCERFYPNIRSNAHATPL